MIGFGKLVVVLFGNKCVDFFFFSVFKYWYWSEGKCDFERVEVWKSFFRLFVKSGGNVGGVEESRGIEKDGKKSRYYCDYFWFDKIVYINNFRNVLRKVFKNYLVRKIFFNVYIK